MCIGCDELLTIKHILLTCSEFKKSQWKRFFNYLKTINIFEGFISYLCFNHLLSLLKYIYICVCLFLRFSTADS